MASDETKNVAERITEFILLHMDARPELKRDAGSSLLQWQGDMLKSGIIEIRLKAKRVETTPPERGYRSTKLRRADKCRLCKAPLAAGDMGWWRVIEGGPRIQNDGPYDHDCAKKA